MIKNILSYQQFMELFLKWPHTWTQSKSQQYKKIEITPYFLSDHHGLKLLLPLVPKTTETAKMYKLTKTEQLNTAWKFGQDWNEEEAKVFYNWIKINK